MSTFMSPSEVIRDSLKTVTSACPALLEMQRDRASGALAAMINLGLIDSATYHSAGRDLHELFARRKTELLRG